MVKQKQPSPSTPVAANTPSLPSLQAPTPSSRTQANPEKPLASSQNSPLGNLESRIRALTRWSGPELPKLQLDPDSQLVELKAGPRPLVTGGLQNDVRTDLFDLHEHHQNEIGELRKTHQREKEAAIKMTRRDEQIKYQKALKRQKAKVPKRVEALPHDFRYVSKKDIQRILTSHPNTMKLFKNLAAEELARYRRTIKAQYQNILDEIEDADKVEGVFRVLPPALRNFDAHIPEVGPYSGPEEGSAEIAVTLGSTSQVQGSGPKEAIQCTRQNTEDSPNGIKLYDLKQETQRQLKLHAPPPEQAQQPLSDHIEGKGRLGWSTQAVARILGNQYGNDSPISARAAGPSFQALQLATNVDGRRDIENQQPSRMTCKTGVQDKVNGLRESNGKNVQRAAQLEVLKAWRYDELITTGKIQDKAHYEERSTSQKAAIIDQLVTRGAVPRIELS
ncbi:hypothetical protein BP5796_10693 [Coleophoma crateriformis]|uniref:Uncharacterized protein n=1 Tax=Coleophoma crateriformis TaxID=565419 RepID=A0A3D8QR54_9HELO|nr:hypothetical protein BP5796_10693 [Coleophoma crateriformis]